MTSLPLKEFKKDKVFYKGSSSIPGQLILNFHNKITNKCDQRSSIYLGPNKKRSLEYFRPGVNIWNEFRLKKKY